jgi:hypothetical protein
MAQKVERKNSMKQQKTDSCINWISQNIFGVFIAFIIILLFLPFVFTLQSPIGFIDSTKANEIGDAINGLTAPIIGSFSALLVFFALKAQIDFNKKQLQVSEFQVLSHIHQLLIKKIEGFETAEKPNIGFYKFIIEFNIDCNKPLEANKSHIEQIRIEEIDSVIKALNSFKNRVDQSFLSIEDKSLFLHEYHTIKDEILKVPPLTKDLLEELFEYLLDDNSTFSKMKEIKESLLNITNH